MITSIRLTTTLSLILTLTFCKTQPVDFFPENQFSVQNIQPLPIDVKQFVFEPKYQKNKKTRQLNVQELKIAFEDITTECPKELAQKLLEELEVPLIKNKVDKEVQSEKIATEYPDGALDNDQVVEKVILQDTQKPAKEPSKSSNNLVSEQSNPDEITTSPKEEQTFTEENEEYLVKNTVNEDNKKADELKRIQEVTTEVAKKLTEKYQESLNRNSDETKKSPEEEAQEAKYTEAEEAEGTVKKAPNKENGEVNNGQISKEVTTEELHKEIEKLPRKEDSTTLCPEENTASLSVKSLLQVQKNSPLLKLIQQKHAISKRQVPQYYVPKAPPSIRTYQQLQRQYQSFYPKSYVKPASYRYRTKNVQNRRQSNVRPSTSTTTRTTRTTFRKKFRPSPVFP